MEIVIRSDYKILEFTYFWWSLNTKSTLHVIISSFYAA